MDRREFLTAIGATPIALAVPAGVAAHSTPEAAVTATSIRAALVARLHDALSEATCLDLSGLEASDHRHGWRERVRDAAWQLAAFDEQFPIRA
jgi:hypothetical protein